MAAISLQPGAAPANAHSRRGILGALAAAPVMALPVTAAASVPLAQWDNACRDYCRARDADRHDAHHGALQAAYDLYDQRTAAFAAKYQFSMNAPEEIRVVWSAYYDEMAAAEDRHATQYGRPRWCAFATLKATPAPTAAALLQKIELAEDEEGDPESIVEFVKDDLRRLAGH